MDHGFLIEQLEKRRAIAANDAIIFMTETGKAMARGRAYAFNEAVKMVKQHFNVPETPPSDECKEGGRY